MRLMPMRRHQVTCTWSPSEPPPQDPEKDGVSNVIGYLILSNSKDRAFDLAEVEARR